MATDPYIMYWLATGTICIAIMVITTMVSQAGSEFYMYVKTGAGTSIVRVTATIYPNKIKFTQPWQGEFPVSFDVRTKFGGDFLLAVMDEVAGEIEPVEVPYIMADPAHDPTVTGAMASFTDILQQGVVEINGALQRIQDVQSARADPRPLLDELARLKQKFLDKLIIPAFGTTGTSDIASVSRISRTFRVAFTKSTKHPVLHSVQIGSPVKDIREIGYVDTGSEIPLIDSRLAAKIKAPATSKVYIQAINGALEPVDTTRIKVTFAPGIEIDDVEAAIYPNLRARTGQDFLIDQSLFHFATGMGVVFK